MILFILFYLLVFVVVLSIPSLLLYFLYRWLARKGYKWVGIIVILSSIAFLFFNIYTAIYPLDSFYFDDFKKIASREIPNSASIIEKTASYPDFHGKYISCSLIKLSKLDYAKLLDEFNTDKSLVKDPNIVYSDEFDEVMKSNNTKDIKSAFARNSNGHADQRSYIGFLNDKETIIVWLFQ